MSQTTVSMSMAVGRAGMVADNGPRDVKSRLNPNVAIPFGLAVCRDAADDKIKLPTTTGEAAAVLGVALLNHAMESSDSGDPQYPVKSTIPVLSKGRVWVRAEDAVTQGGDVYVRFANGTTENQKGGFRSDDDKVATVATATKLNGAKWASSASAGGLAIVELNLPA